MFTLGKLEKIDLHVAWPTEAQSFTPWLATEENIALLGEALNMELEVDGCEVGVGAFRADIVCKNVEDDTVVLIENQLERTNHTHLGQIITYAAGTTAATIIWISARFTEEHRAALDWLNEHTSDDVRFFGVQIELWRIGDSNPAARFNIVSKPNDWTRTVSRSTHSGIRPMTEMRELQLKFWTGLKEYLESRKATLSVRTPRARHWMHFSVGRAGFFVSATTNTLENVIRVGLHIRCDNAKLYFAELHSQIKEIEADFGETLSWEERPDQKVSKITTCLGDVDPTDESDWLRQYEWITERVEAFRRVFGDRIRELNAAEAA